MEQPCIAIDVSKGKSHVRGFIGKDNPFGIAFEIDHDKEGFDKLEHLVTMMNSEPEQIFVFESTGIYHRPLRFYLEYMNYRYVEISPLLAAKHRKNSAIRSVKTDVRDTVALANLFYDLLPEESNVTSEVYYELRQLHRHYISLTALQVKCKVHFNEHLDIIY